MNIPYTFFTPADLSILAQAFAVDPVDMISSMMITVPGSVNHDFKVNAWTLFFIRFIFVSLDCLRVQLAHIGFITGIHTLYESHAVMRSI